MPVLRNISGYKVCLQRGAVVANGGTLYVSDLQDHEIASSIRAGIFKVDDIMSPPPVKEPEVERDTKPVAPVEVVEKVPGKKIDRIDGLDVYSPNELNDDDYDIVDGVKVEKLDGGPKFDPSIFIDADK
jgi:hypothetical protein